MRLLPAYVNLIPALAPRPPSGGKIPMAKNKKQNRKQPQSERGPQAPQHSAMEPQSEQHATQVTPGDVARKGRQKSFGHN